MINGYYGIKIRSDFLLQSLQKLSGLVHVSVEQLLNELVNDKQVMSVLEQNAVEMLKKQKALVNLK